MHHLRSSESLLTVLKGSRMIAMDPKMSISQEVLRNHDEDGQSFLFVARRPR